MKEVKDIITKALILLAPYVPLFQTILWILLIAILAIIFHKQCIQILKSILNRIEKGSSIKVGPVELRSDLKSLDYASPEDSDEVYEVEENDLNVERTAIYQKNKGIFLTHIISHSNNPNQKFDIFIYLIRHKTSDFTDIERAEFFFGHMWGNRVFEEYEKNGIIGVSTSAYGPFSLHMQSAFQGRVSNKVR